MIESATHAFAPPAKVNTSFGEPVSPLIAGESSFQTTHLGEMAAMIPSNNASSQGFMNVNVPAGRFQAIQTAPCPVNVRADLQAPKAIPTVCSIPYAEGDSIANGTNSPTSSVATIWPDSLVSIDDGHRRSI